MVTPARYWREIPQRYRLEAGKCAACGKTYFPPRVVCACGSREFETVQLNDEGTIQTFTVIRVAPSQFTDEAPYVVGIVELNDGVRLTTQVVDCDPSTVLPGMDVDLEFRLIQKEGNSGILCYGHKGVPGTL